MQRTPTCKNCCRNYGFKDVSKPVGNRIPLLLECGHTFCEGCVTKWARLQKTQVLCPECHHCTPLTAEGEKGIKSIQANIFLLGTMINTKRASFSSDVQRSGRSKLGTKAGLQRAISQFTQEKKAELMNTDSGVKCEECSRASASSRCAKCDTVYCTVCFEKVHSYSNALRKHVPLPMSQSSSETASGCPEHDNRPFEFYDKDEGQPVCSHCVVIGERQNHNVIPIDEIAKEVQVQFKVSLEEATTVVKHLETSQQKICGALPGVKAEKNHIINDIREHFQKLFALLQSREHMLIKDVEMHHDEEKTLEKLREEVTENLQRAKSYVQELDNVIRQPQKLIDNAKQLKSQLESVQGMSCCAIRLLAEGSQVKFEAGGELEEVIAGYGSVSTNGNARFVLKRMCEVTDEDLEHDSDSGELDISETTEKPTEVENTAVSEDNRQFAGTTRSSTAAKILKADLAYRHEMVHVTHIRDPCQFMVQRIADMEQLQIMMNVINLYCDSTENVHDLLYEVKYGDWCCGQFTTDNQWYRARIIAAFSPAHPNVVPTLENDLCVEVQYIDYGNTEWLPLSRLRKMKPEFLEVPELAQCCSLADIVPPFQEEKWPSKAIKAFGSLTGEKPLLMTVVGKKGSKLFIDLRRPEDDEPTQDDDRPVSVRDALVFLEVARFSTPLSKPEAFFPKKNYKEPTTIGEGAFVDVLVTHVVGPDELYVQKLRSEETVELQRIMEEMSKMFGGRRRGTEWSVPWPYKGLVCASRFSEDKVWYRALVTAVNSDETVDVTYVDFGNSERLPFSDIRKLPDMFLRLPKQAVPTCLVDIKPNGDDTEWKREDQDNVANLLMNRSLVVDVKGTKDDRTTVLLYDTSGAQDVNINEFLVQNGYCQPAGLGIVRSQEEMAAESERTTESQEPEELQEAFKEPKVPVESAVLHEAQDAQSVPLEEKMTPEDKVRTQSTSSSVDEVLSGPATYLEFQYKPATVPYRRRFQAGITFVDSQGYIYAQEVKEGDRTLIDVMSALLERYGKGDDVTAAPSDVTAVSPGLPCCAQYAEDGMWYRARVVKFTDDDKVEVNYIDFGNSEVVPLSSLRQEMPFMEVPQQCVQLVLHGVEPKTSDGHWPPKTIGVLSQFIVGQDCTTFIRGDKLPGYPLVVNLSLPDGTDVAQALLGKGLVQKSPTLRDGEEPPPQFFPRKNRPVKAKQKQTVRSVTETREHAQKISSREAVCMLAQTELPEDDIRFDVTITHIERPDCLFIQRVPPTEVDKGFADDPDPTLVGASVELRKLEEMMAKINAAGYFKNYTPLLTACEGMLCCARYTEDDMWYRAQVKAVQCDKPLQVRVLYVDYGTTEVITADRLRGFPSELLDLPIQSTRCFLADVNPPDKWEGPMMDDKQWPVETMEALVKVVAGKKLVAKTMFHGPPASVMLYDHRTREDGCTEEVSIGLLLAQKGLARSDDPDTMKPDRSVVRSDEENCEPKLLEFYESKLNFASAISATSTESKGISSSSALLEKILAPKMGFEPASPPKQPLLKPSEFSPKVEEEKTSRICDLPAQDLNLDGSSVKPNEESFSDEQNTANQPRDQEEVSADPLTSDHVTSTSQDGVEVNKDSVESSV